MNSLGLKNALADILVIFVLKDRKYHNSLFS